mmetsp:Transcript_29654/g.71249  ORF Transcript_29654/g.71249 Transcript_29654/m.71249 type:complete len:359 (+) Transcript_29654:31-1107(+)
MEAGERRSRSQATFVSGGVLDPCAIGFVSRPVSPPRKQSLSTEILQRMYGRGYELLVASGYRGGGHPPLELRKRDRRKGLRENESKAKKPRTDRLSELLPASELLRDRVRHRLSEAPNQRLDYASLIADDLVHTMLGHCGVGRLKSFLRSNLPEAEVSADGQTVTLLSPTAAALELPWRCHGCDKGFDDRAGLAAHVKERLLAWTTDDPLDLCKALDLDHADRAALLALQDTFEDCEDVVCPECGWSGTDVEQLIRHAQATAGGAHSRLIDATVAALLAQPWPPLREQWRTWAQASGPLRDLVQLCTAGTFDDASKASYQKLAADLVGADDDIFGPSAAESGCSAAGARDVDVVELSD